MYIVALIICVNIFNALIENIFTRKYNWKEGSGF